MNFNVFLARRYDKKSQGFWSNFPKCIRFAIRKSFQHTHSLKGKLVCRKYTVKRNWLKQIKNWLSHIHLEFEITNFLVGLINLFLARQEKLLAWKLAAWRNQLRTFVDGAIIRGKHTKNSDVSSKGNSPGNSFHVNKFAVFFLCNRSRFFTHTGFSFWKTSLIQVFKWDMSRRALISVVRTRKRKGKYS